MFSSPEKTGVGGKHLILVKNVKLQCIFSFISNIRLKDL